VFETQQRIPGYRKQEMCQPQSKMSLCLPPSLLTFRLLKAYIYIYDISSLRVNKYDKRESINLHSDRTSDFVFNTLNKNPISP